MGIGSDILWDLVRGRVGVTIDMKSSAIASIRFSVGIIPLSVGDIFPDMDGELTVNFRKGRPAVCNATLDEFAGFLSAESPGRYFNAVFKGR